MASLNQKLEQRLTTPALLFKSPFPPGKVTFLVSPVVTSGADVLK